MIKVRDRVRASGWGSRSDLGRVAPTLFMISVQLNLDQKLNQDHAELHFTKTENRYSTNATYPDHKYNSI